MMESLNQLATQYAGFLAVAGFVLGLISAIAAVYFYYNPRRSSYRLSYKIYANSAFGVGLRRIGNIVKKEKNRTYSQHIDVWNAGGEPIAQDVIREPVSIALQSASTAKGTLISSLQVVRETHPGVSAFLATLEGQRGSLTWAHFDPGMGARILVETTAPVGSDEIAVFGQGLRLNFRRARNLSEVGGLPNFCRMAVVISLPIVATIIAGGPFLEWLSSRDVNGLIAYISFVALVACIVAVIISVVAACVGLHNLSEWAFNTKSPIEKTEGEPSRASFSSDESRLQYIEMRRADAAFRSFETSADEMGTD